jgi:hypothetical protein
VEAVDASERHRNHNEEKESDLTQGISKASLAFFSKNIVLLQGVLAPSPQKRGLLVQVFGGVTVGTEGDQSSRVGLDPSSVLKN